jgi:hypothetical protein
VGAALVGLVVLGGSVFLLWGLKVLDDRVTARHPVATAAVNASVVIPAVGVLLAGIAQTTGADIEQGENVFGTLAQLIATLLIAFAVEAAAFRLAGRTQTERHELAVLVGGTAAGAVIGLVAAIWGLIHPWPGLVVLGIAVAAVLLLAVILVLRPVVRILRQDVATAE